MEIINKCKEILSNFGAEEIDGYIVDVQTANAIITVYNALGEKNRQNFITQPITRMSDIAWRLVTR